MSKKDNIGIETPKRKAPSTSSVSELDSSKNSHSTPFIKKQKSKGKKALKKRRKIRTDVKDAEDDFLSEQFESELEEMDDEDDDDDDNMPLSIQKHLADINKKLNDVVKKSDTSLIKSIIKDTLIEMKDMLTETFVHRLEVLEGEIHDISVENKKLKTEVEKLNKKVEQKNEEQQKLEQKIEKEENKRSEIANEQEQYSRRNNIRIMSLPGDHQRETADETTGKVLDMFKNKLKLEFHPRDIDIAHRLGKHSDGKLRQVIVKFVNRNAKYRVMASKKVLKGSQISIFEDLTRLNNEVLASARKKMKNEIEQCWSKDGKLFIKWKANGNIERIEHKDYRQWLEMPWP